MTIYTPDIRNGDTRPAVVIFDDDYDEIIEDREIPGGWMIED